LTKSKQTKSAIAIKRSGLVVASNLKAEFPKHTDPFNAGLTQRLVIGAASSSKVEKESPFLSPIVIVTYRPAMEHCAAHRIHLPEAA
jgi:hypothetical protein